MKVIVSKKAQAIINTFNKRENDVYNTGIGYLKEDMNHILACDAEINKYNNPNPEKYREAIRQQTKMSFRAEYLLQCLELYVHCNFETNSIEVKTINDK